MHPDSVRKISGTILYSASLLRQDITRSIPNEEAQEALVHLEQCELAVARYFYKIMDAGPSETPTICDNCGRFYVGICPEQNQHE